MFAEALVNAFLRGPDPRITAWTRDPCPHLPLTPEEAALCSNPPTPPRVAPILSDYTQPPAPEGVDKDAADELIAWFAGEAVSEFNIHEQFQWHSGFEVEQACMAAEGYAECRNQGRIPKSAPAADDVTADYAIDVAMGRAHAKLRAERASNAAEMQAMEAWRQSPEVVAYRDLRTRIALHRTPDAIAARIQANGERVTGYKSYADFLISIGAARTPDAVTIPEDVAASIVMWHV